MQPDQESSYFNKEYSYYTNKTSLADTSTMSITSLNNTTSNNRNLTQHKFFNIGIITASCLRAHDLSFFQNTIPNTQYKILSDNIIVNGEDDESINDFYQLFKSKVINDFKKEEFKVNEVKDIYILQNTPSILKYLKNNECVLIHVQLNLAISSFKKTQEQLKAIKNTLLNNNVWVTQWRNPNHNHTIYNHIADYLKQMLDKNMNFFKQRDMKVEINTKNSHICIDGVVSYKKMEVKNFITNIINSTVVMEIKTNSKNMFKKAEQFIVKSIQHPIIFRRVGENLYILITKDNIIKQLLMKDKFRLFVNSNNQNKIGIFLLEIHKFGDKITSLKNFVTNNHFYLEQRSIFYYFFESMNTDNQGPNKYIDFVVRALQYLMNIAKKNKAETNLRIQKKPQITDDKQFIALGFPSLKVQQYSNLFGCDIKMTTVYLNSKYQRKYQEISGQQQRNQIFNVVDWCDPNETRVLKIQRQKMNGCYYYGTVKKNKNDIIYRPECLIEVL